MATPTKSLPRDPNTFANYDKFRTTHTTANFEIEFEQQRLVGNVIHQLKSMTNAESKEIVLDSSFVDVDEIKIDGKKASFEVLPRSEPFGSAVKVTLDAGVELDKTLELDISVKTTRDCTALQWLTPAQTSNKKHPYMFSQCQAIHSRSCFPCQDTPDVKAPFTFSIISPLPVLASGVPIGEPTEVNGQSGKKLYKFEQKVPIPSYLFALASGDIVEAPIGPRSVVATSPDKLEECKWELEADTERFLQAAEELIFPYKWGPYNVLILPPSFPYGGMENPIFTFATPSLISKDRENVDVIAHELAHSWSGNLVSAGSWEHFWLNEGWTVYIERRIIGKIHGDAHRHFSAIIGWKALTDAITKYGEGHEFTQLVVNLEGKDPDDAFSSIPYEKGFNFLFYLENLVGIEKFDKFIPHYFTTFQGKSLDSFEFKKTLLDFFASDSEASAALGTVDWNTWFYAPGFPPKPKFDTSLVDVVYELADKWEKISEPTNTFEPSPNDIKGLMANQVVVLLERIMLFEKKLRPEDSFKMGEVYGLAKSENIEVSNLYFRIGLEAGDKSVLKPTCKLLGEIGRMKFVRPLFKRLAAFDRELAIKTFKENKDFYHPICRQMVEKDLFGSK